MRQSGKASLNIVEKAGYPSFWNRYTK